MTAKMEELQKRVIGRGESKKAIAEALELPLWTVYSIHKLYRDTGGFTKHENGGRKRSVRTDRLITDMNNKIQSARGDCSVQGLSREFNMAQRTMERVVKLDLGLQTLVKRRVQLLTAS